jgi:type I restriction enzyme, R subunit
MSLNESIVEDAALEWFRRRRLLRQGYEGQEGYAGQVGELGYTVGHGAAIAGLRRAKPSLVPGEPAAERQSFGDLVLVGRLRKAIRRLNPAIPSRTLATLRDPADVGPAKLLSRGCQCIPANY